MKIRKKIPKATVAGFLLLILLLTGCSKEAADTSQTVDENKEFPIEQTGAIQDIKERGYMTVGCKNDVPGFGYYNEETGEYEGGEIELAWWIAAKIFDVTCDEAKEQNLVHFEPVLVEDREKVLTEGDVDYVIATYTITEERQEEVAFSESYYEDAVGMMIMKEKNDNSSLSDPKITSVADLDGKKIGIMSGSTTREEMLRYLERNAFGVVPRFMEYNTYEKLNNALEKGEIDVFCVDTCILKGYQGDNKTILSGKFSPQDYGVAADKDKPELIDAANVVLEELDYRGIYLFE